MKVASLFLGFTALVLLGTFALLWQIFVPGSTPVERNAAARPSASTALRKSEPESNGVRSVYPGLGSAAPVRPMQVADERALRTALLAEPAPAQSNAEPPAPEPPAASAPVMPVVPAPAEPMPQSSVEPQAVTEGSVDLNTATLEQLNGLGAGMIGRRIIASRPYTAPEDLVARRVLTRRDYETIRPRVVAAR